MPLATTFKKQNAKMKRSGRSVIILGIEHDFFASE